MSKQHSTIYSQTALFIALFNVIVFALREGTAQETQPPPIVAVTIDDQKSVIVHRGLVQHGPIKIRVNVPDVRSAEFQHDLKRLAPLNCTVVPPPAGPANSASRFYPAVSKVNGADFEIYRSELIKTAIGKRIAVTRSVTPIVADDKAQGANADLSHRKPTGTVFEVIEGTLMGFKPVSEEYNIQILGDMGQLKSVDSKVIVDIVFQEDLDELKKLAGLLKRQSGFDKQAIECTPIDASLVVQFSYAQLNVAEHTPVVTVFAEVNEARDSVQTSEAWATIWNDTFYDWNNVTVVVQSKTETYTVESVSLSFGQRGSFLISATLPKIQVKHRWNVVAPNDDTTKTATVSSVLELSNTSPNGMPRSIWNIKDWQGKDLVVNTVLEKLPSGKKNELIIASDTISEIKVASSKVPFQVLELQGEQLICRPATEKIFTFPNSKEQSELLVKDGDTGLRSVVLAGGQSGTLALPEIVLDPKLSNKKIVSLESLGTTVTVRSIDSPGARQYIDLFRESSTTFSKLMSADNAVPILDEIIKKKKEIESIQSALAKLELERKDLAKRPNIGEKSSYRIPLQRDSMRMLQRKDAEIQDQRDALAKAEFDLAEFLRAQPKDALPMPITPVQALRELGGQVTLDKQGVLTDVTFGGVEPAGNIDDTQLFDAIGEAMPSLQSLVLPGCSNIDGSRLNELGRSRIAWLNLSGTSATDETLKSLPVLYTLKSLDLSGTNISSQSVSTILKCKRLEHLSVAGTNFNNIGLMKLCGIDSLSSLNLRGTRISKAEIQAFMDRRPGVVVFASEEAGLVLPPPGQPSLQRVPKFDSSSFWYQRVDGVRELHEQSPTLVQEFLRQKAQGGNGTADLVGINTTAYASPVFFANESTPRINVTVTNCLNINEKDFETLKYNFMNIPFPDEAIPAEGTDGEMTIYDPLTDTLWEFWRLEKTDQGWRACWGGRLNDVTKSRGIHERPFGTTAACLPLIGGQITAEELLEGEIKHAIGIALVRAKKGIWSWPAQKDDGEDCDNTKNCVEADLIMEGQRFRLDPEVNVDELDMHPVGKIIARAAQRYGFVVWDKGGATGIRAQNPKSNTQLGLEDPYPDLFCPKDQWTVLDNFPWEKLQFFKKDFGKPE